MIDSQVQATLMRLHEEIRNLQAEHGVSAAGSIETWYAYGDDSLVVQSDGCGRADLMLVDDHFPFDGFMLHHSYRFEDAHEAGRAAAWFDDLLENSDSTMSATEFFRLLKEGKHTPWNAAD